MIKKITNISLLLAFVLVANCAQHSVKFGKKCTQVAKDGTYEKSFVWIVNNKINPDFDKKITRQNCISAESWKNVSTAAMHLLDKIYGYLFKVPSIDVDAVI